MYTLDDKFKTVNGSVPSGRLALNLPVVNGPGLRGEAGTYPITLSGGSDSRYSFNLHDGILTILKETSIKNANAVDVSIWSRKGKIIIQSNEFLAGINIFDISGKQIAGERNIRQNELQINVNAGIYIVKYWTKNGTGMKKIAVR